MNLYKTIAALLLLIVALQACKRTEYEQALRPYTEIEHFSIAGYGELDSVQGVIKDDSILIYWNQGVEQPEQIAPNITVSSGASVTPSSGEAVAFTEGTTYTVTAEDGSQKKYILKPVINTIVPQITTARANTSVFDIFGLNFLKAIGDDKTNVRAYARRLADGYEFDIPLDTSTINDVYMQGSRQDFTLEQDTGYHSVVLDFGDNLPKISQDVWLGPIFLRDGVEVVATSIENVSGRGPIYADEDASFKINLSGPKAKYMEMNVVPYYFTLRLANIGETTTSKYITTLRGLNNMTIKDGVISLHIPASAADYAGMYVQSIYVLAAYKISPSSYNGSYDLTYVFDNTDNVIALRK